MILVYAEMLTSGILSSFISDFGHCHNVALIDTLLTFLTLIDDLLGIYYIICTMGAIVVVFRGLPQGENCRHPPICGYALIAWGWLQFLSLI